MKDNTLNVEVNLASEGTATPQASPDRKKARSGMTGSAKKRNRANRRRLLWSYLFIAPFCLVFLCFNVGAYIYSLFLSFHRYAGYGEAIFIGLNNYIATLQYHVFWTELWNTLFYWLAHTLVLIPTAFLLAFLIRSQIIRGQRFWKPVIFLPQVMTIVAVSLVFQTLFSTQYGVINQVFNLNLQWLEDYGLTRWVIVILLIWQGLGFWFVVFLAGLTSIDPSLEEAAVVDGASVWQRLRYVIIPLMRNIFLFAFAIDAINSMRLYTQPNILVTGNALASPEIAPILNLLVSNLQGGSFGQSAAVGWLLFLITLIITGVLFGVFRLTGKD